MAKNTLSSQNKNDSVIFLLLLLFRNKFAFHSSNHTDDLKPKKIGIFVDFESGQVQYTQNIHTTVLFCLPTSRIP